MAVAVLKVRELGGVMIVHAMNDFLKMTSTVVQNDLNLAEDYTTVEDPNTAYITYALLLAVDIIPMILTIRALKKQKGPDRGAFMAGKSRRESRGNGRHVRGGSEHIILIRPSCKEGMDQNYTGQQRGSGIRLQLPLRLQVLQYFSRFFS